MSKKTVLRAVAAVGGASTLALMSAGCGTNKFNVTVTEDIGTPTFLNVDMQNANGFLGGHRWKTLTLRVSSMTPQPDGTVTVAPISAPSIQSDTCRVSSSDPKTLTCSPPVDENWNSHLALSFNPPAGTTSATRYAVQISQGGAQAQTVYVNSNSQRFQLPGQ